MQEQQPRKRGPKSINYAKRGIKIKEEVDALVKAILAEKRNATETVAPRKFRLSEIDMENEDLDMLLEMQFKLSKVIREKTKNNK